MEDRSESDRASARGAPGIVFEEGVDQRVPEDRLGDIDSGFFSRFANCSLDDAFAVIEEAAGKGPKTFAGVAAPFDHEQFIALNDDRIGRIEDDRLGRAFPRFCCLVDLLLLDEHNLKPAGSTEKT